jgi:hypothetical protein
MAWIADAFVAGLMDVVPVMNDVRDQPRRRGVDLVILPTAQAITVLAKTTKDTNAVLAPDLLTRQRGTANTAAAACLLLPRGAACLRRGSGSRFSPGRPLPR